LSVDKFDEKLFSEWIKNPHYTHHFFIYDSYHQYNSPWNGVLQRLDNKAPTDSPMIEKLIEANLEHLQIKQGVDITKKFGSYLREHNLQTIKGRIDYLNNLKVDDN
jgi:hypothetical protein